MLKRLEMFGFKSFADRTVFDFVPGITCVVGPNGSGKSNVVDAIKWLLGDQSPKSLRGKEMADVIFNGAVGRKGSGFAEASLTFDNTEGRLPLEMAEVQIGRRLYRSGESEYLLNGNVVRLKDIRELLMGTAAGTSAYSIIEQGRVDQILQANPTTRRVVFEEAAGISKFKSRRIEAERKLERVDQNLVRLTDIVDEVETQLNSTRNQASRAARFREVSAELQRIWTGLAADEYRRLSTEHGQLETEAAACREQTGTLNEELSRIQHDNVSVEEALLDVDGRLRKCHALLTRDREQVAAHESTIRHQTVRSRELDGEIAELRWERRRLIERRQCGAAELDETGRRLEQFAAALSGQQETMERREAQVAELQRLVEQARLQIADQRREREELSEVQAAHRNRAATLTSQAESGRQAVETAREERDDLAVRSEAAAHERARRKDAVLRLERSLDSAAARLKNLQDERMRLLDEQGDSQKSLAVMREQRVAWDARIHVLENLERRQEGLGVGVRDILERARTLDSAPWNSIVGCVGDLLDVPLEHAALLEVALGQRVQLVVTRSRPAVVDYLNQTNAPIKGRVGFIEAGAHSENDEAELHDLTGEPGVVVRADRLASEPDEVRGLATRLLARTWIVESLDDALRLAQGAGRTCQFVTLQGELLDAGGVLFAGTVPTETSMVSRKSELRQLRLDLISLDDEIDEQLSELSALGKNLTGVDADLGAAAEARQEVSEQLADAKARLRAQISDCDRIDQERSRIDETLQQLTAGTVRTEEELSQTETAAAETAERIARLTREMREAEAETDQLQDDLTAILEGIKREQLELAKHEERVLALRATQDRLERDQAQREQQAAEANVRLESMVAARRRANLQVLNAEAAVAELFCRIEEQSLERRELESDRSRLRSQRAELNQAQSRLEREKREISEAGHRCEIRMNEISHQLTTLAERIHEEYQVSLEELVTSGVSAYEDWLSEQASDEDAHVDDDSDVAELMEDAESDDAETGYDEIRGELEERVQRLRRKLKSMGNVNIDALESLDELENRYGQLSGQLQDLQEAQAALEDIIRRINVESRRMFLESFESIREHFRDLFRQLFGGGEADIVLEDPEDVLECGIDIVARPPGKELRSISLLSGGEKTLTAVALLFAMFKSNPSPYCILDEVDAALDEANVERYSAIVKDFVSMTQFIVITHRKRTMVAADVLYGVTMEQAGVSKRMSVRFEDVTENGEIRSSGRAA